MTQTLLKPDEQTLAEALTFISGFSSVVLGSVTTSGQPHTSYAPYIADNNNFYAYVSGLAQHASTLKNGMASLFFIENEQQAKSIFARKRLTINCRVSSINRDKQCYDSLLDALQARHGSTVKLLRTLPDFILFEFRPEQANFVTGFGAAYDLGEALPALTKAAGHPPA
jgi:putative heme iron utilization protein